ncbi:MAG: hypothetical protein JST42_15770 [Bacteroidetes bacterium]|nr:hypothetical protein [Bacteroidota bacterium]
MLRITIHRMHSLAIVITVLPLLSALLIFGRKLYLQEPLNFLLTICLLSFFRGMLELAWPLTNWPLTKENQFIITKLFSLALLLLLVPCFRPDLNGRNRYLLDLSLTALLSFAITCWSLLGWNKANPAIDAIFNTFLALLILASLPAVIRNSALHVLQAPRFYIATGTLFYIFLYLLLEGIGFCCRPAASPSDTDQHFFVLLAEGVKYLFYTAAAALTRPSPEPSPAQ